MEVMHDVAEQHKGHVLPPHPVHCARSSVVSTCLITDGVNLDHLAKVLSVGFLLCKVTDFPFMIIVYLGRGR